MKFLLPYRERVAECVGLWLAEGDQKSKSEITFTNNCLELVNLFYKNLTYLFKNCRNIRIYVYSREDQEINIYHKNCTIKYYKDNRARKPYFIVRLTSVEKVKDWKRIIKETLNNKNLYPFVLKGFFAGKGNIKKSSNCSRSIRIAQKNENRLLEKILSYFKVNYSFYQNERNYYIYGKKNWDIFAELRLADLHPEKREKFWKVYGEFKEEHYKHNYLLRNIYFCLKTPNTTKDLSKKFNRSFTRIQEILISLKKQEKIKNFRVGSIDYWTNNLNLIIISKIKKNYLLFLNKPRKTFEFARKFNVCHKSSFKRLKELERLNLVIRDKTKMWKKININKELTEID